MDIEKAKPSRGGDAKPWVQLADVRIARLPKARLLLLTFISLIILPVLGVNNQAFSEMLSWTIDSEGVKGYKIFYGESCNNLNSFIDVGNVTRYSINTLPLNENKSYCLAVKAYNYSVESPFSNTVYWTSTDNTPPAPPTEVRAQ